MKKNYISKKHWFSLTICLFFSCLSVLFYNYFDKSLSLQLADQKVERENSASILLEGLLFLGILTSALLGLLIFFYLKSLEAAKNIEFGNQQLISASKELEEQRVKAEKASKAKTEFLSNMSHEMRTPLNAIMGLCDLLNSRTSYDEQENYLHMMQESSKTLLRLVNDVLAIERIESGNISLAQDRFKPSSIVENLVGFFNSEINRKKLALSICLNNCKEKIVLGDRTKFEQISLNIVSNAIKFTKKGTVSIICEEKLLENSLVAVSLIVKDTGIGIPAGKQEMIFDRFTQLDEGVRKKHSGGGLGLYITRQLVHLMHGTIEVASETGKGSTFKVNLKFPLVKDNRNEISENFAMEFSSMQLEVLAVDDNKLNVIILTKLLKNMGMNTDIAYNGKEALNKTIQKNYDIIFMDVHMPEMDGYEATRHIRKMNKEVLILGLSADVTTSAIEEGIYAGMNDYLTKPLDREKLAVILTRRFEKEMS